MVAAAAAAAKRRHRHRRLRTMAARLLRLAEAVAAALLLLSWSSSSTSTPRIPAAAEHLRRLGSLLLSPRFVFLLGNAIVLLLFADSRHLSPSLPSLPFPFPFPSRGYSVPAPAPAPAPEFEDKEAVRVEMRRSRSERIGGKDRRRRRSPELRRSETDLGIRRRKEAAPAAEEEWVPSAEEAAEFRRTIEAFIAKQTNFHREESMAIVSSSSSFPRAEPTVVEALLQKE
ncbi:hypothetical protein ACMD2_22867 [Ananas comosus]|uniref:DUF4408 domain-containing protein n=1 Tax=Ananas comosus TaxID=4615 RepID=A0A199VD02_ANACO|nr:hypothetical protein ACMD2_22867 [Ananas comosus]